MEALVLDGKNYVKASKAAKDLGYATDYVGQLCRSGQIDAHLIGRTWYVHQEMLQNHKTEKKRISRLKAREYARKTKEEYTKKREETAQRKVAIAYEHDSSDLIPKTRTLAIASDSPHHDIEEDTKGGNEVENSGKKIKMKGSIDVYDADGGPNDGTTILTPRFERKRPLESDIPHHEKRQTAQSGTVRVEPLMLEEEEQGNQENQAIPVHTDEGSVVEAESIVESTIPEVKEDTEMDESERLNTSFLDKLAEQEVDTEKATEEADVPTKEVASITARVNTEIDKEGGNGTLVLSIAIVIIALTISLSSVFFVKQYNYSSLEPYQNETKGDSSFSIDQNTLIKLESLLKK